jgi:hypothetical protein
MNKKRIYLYLATVLVIAFIAYFAGLKQEACTQFIQGVKKQNYLEELKQDKGNQNESLFIGCNGFF